MFAVTVEQATNQTASADFLSWFRLRRGREFVRSDTPTIEVKYIPGAAMSHLESWCKAMASQAASRVALSNLIHDVEKGRLLDADRLAEVIDDVIERWSNRKPTRSPEKENAGAVQTLVDVLESLPERYVLNGPPATAHRWLSRVWDRTTLAKRLIRKSALAEVLRPGADPGPPPPVGDDPDVWRPAKSGIRKDAKIAGRLRPVAWVTRTDDLNGLRSGLGPDDIASRFRDFLGLDFYKRGKHLVEIIYPENEVQALHAPTIFDGGCAAVYQSVERGDKWGRSVDLSNLTNDGAAEAVHGPVDFTPAFSIRFLGSIRRITVRQGNELLGKCERQWKDGDVQRLQACSRRRTRP